MLSDLHLYLVNVSLAVCNMFLHFKRILITFVYCAD